MSSSWTRVLQSMWTAAVAAAIATGCANERPKPAALEPLTAAIAGRTVWTQRLEAFGPGSMVASTGGVFTVATSAGTVAAFEPETGRAVWRASLNTGISAGPGTDGRFTAVVTTGNDLVVLENATEKWRKPLGQRVSTPPLVAGERVFVLAVDRSVQAFDAADGQRLWTLARPGEPLLLTQVGVIAPYRDTLVVGQGVRLTGVDSLRGTVRWEIPMAAPRGTNEIERLADLVGPLARFGNRVCARAFQTTVACADVSRATQSWSKTVGGVNGIEVDESFVFAADGSDRITAWRAASGEVAWTNERLLNRGLSAPLSVDKTVVFGDVEGQVHFLARETGVTQLRLPTDGSAIVAKPAAIGLTIAVITRSGSLVAMRPQ